MNHIVPFIFKQYRAIKMVSTWAIIIMAATSVTASVKYSFHRALMPVLNLMRGIVITAIQITMRTVEKTSKQTKAAL